MLVAEDRRTRQPPEGESPFAYGLELQPSVLGKRLKVKVLEPAPNPTRVGGEGGDVPP